MTDLSPDVQGLLDESYESDFTEEESERLLLLCGHGIGPKLSPAAQAVLNAIKADLDLPTWDVMHRITDIAAFALRAAADQVVPNDPQEAMYFTTEAIRLNRQGIRRQLLAIASELEQYSESQ